MMRLSVHRRGLSLPPGCLEVPRCRLRRVQRRGLAPSAFTRSARTATLLTTARVPSSAEATRPESALNAMPEGSAVVILAVGISVLAAFPNSMVPKIVH